MLLTNLRSKKVLPAGRTLIAMGEDIFRRPNFMLTTCALEAIFERLGQQATILEMGSGDGTVTRH